MTFLNVSANGPAAGSIRGAGNLPTFYPKAAAQLEYTTNDALYYSRHWQQDEGWPGPVQFTNHDLVSAEYQDVRRAITESPAWFGERVEENEYFDGGGIHFTFSGHGREDGVLLLDEDTYFAPSDLIELALELRKSANIQAETKLVVYLDSCYSGKFILDLWDLVVRECGEELGVFHAKASSYPDELSYEIPELGHGLATFCNSMRNPLFGLVSKAGIKNVATWGVMQGGGGCSLATMGKQNPITISNYGEVAVCNRTFSLYDDEWAWKASPKHKWEQELEAARSAFQDGVKGLYGVTSNSDASLEEHLEKIISVTIGGITHRMELMRENILNPSETS